MKYAGEGAEDRYERGGFEQKGELSYGEQKAETKNSWKGPRSIAWYLFQRLALSPLFFIFIQDVHQERNQLIHSYVTRYIEQKKKSGIPAHSSCDPDSDLCFSFFFSR